VVDAWQLENWEAYRDVVRLGRKTRLPEAQRKVAWSIFERVRAGMQSRQLITYAALFSSLATAIPKNKNVVFDYAVVDEAQDISPAHLRFFAALGGGIGQMPSFSLAIWASVSSSSRSLGKPSAWTSGDARAPCALITAPPTKSALRRTGCSARS
jgi:hypothetical protein